jgi:hypothetical protein
MTVMVVHEVRYGCFVAAAKALTVSLPITTRNVWVPVLITVVDVWPTVIFNVLACAFDAVMKALTLNFLVFLRRRIPSSALLTEASRGNSLRRVGCSGRD